MGNKHYRHGEIRVEPKSPTALSESEKRDLQEAQERETALSAIVDKRANACPIDKIIESIYKARIAFHNWSSQELEINPGKYRTKLYIDRYYPTLHLAIDYFKDEAEKAAGFTDDKRKILNAMETLYVAVTLTDGDLHKAIAKAELQQGISVRA
jgi:hypothetical protein